MKSYISHESALKLWDFPLAQQYYQLGNNPGEIEHVTVTEKRFRFFSDRYKIHVCSTPLPKSSFACANGLDLVSPPLMFVQMANELDIIELILLGNLLCSLPNGPFSKAVTTRQKLINYAKSAEGLFGRKKALRALKYVSNDACSIMEIFLAMFLSLPRSLGGLGLKGGVFNYPLLMDGESFAAIKKNQCFIDYCFPKEKIGYEYQGEIHNSSVDQDSSRIMALTLP